MEIKSEIINNVPILKVIGRVVSTNSLDFIKQLKALGKHETPKVVLDLQETSFLDSASVGIICAVHMDRHNSGKRLEIIIDSSPDNFIFNLFETTGLSNVLHITRVN
jgi:anti-anti-sigma factor